MALVAACRRLRVRALARPVKIGRKGRYYYYYYHYYYHYYNYYYYYDYYYYHYYYYYHHYFFSFLFVLRPMWPRHRVMPHARGPLPEYWAEVSEYWAEVSEYSAEVREYWAEVREYWAEVSEPPALGSRTFIREAHREFMISYTIIFIFILLRRVGDHRMLPHYSQLLNNICVRQVGLSGTNGGPKEWGLNIGQHVILDHLELYAV